ncbi:MAG TPA: hypothetical protein VIE89_21860 [Candidatus Binatia bacterium]|jgi:hypothetical protein
MREPVDPLMLQFLTWVASRDRTYAEAMEAWQTTCPRHTVWEDALINGFIQLQNKASQSWSEVKLTRKGKAILDESIHESIQSDQPRHT